MKPLMICPMAENVKLPVYSTSEAAGFDLYAWKFNDEAANKTGVYYLNPRERLFIHTGLKMAIPTGYYLLVTSRSGLACKQGVVVINAPAVIDSDYRGEVMICLENLSNDIIKINLGDRIAQGILQPCERPSDIIVTDVLPDTDRGEGGFGSTGK